jgi:hypothetical protein
VADTEAEPAVRRGERQLPAFGHSEVHTSTVIGRDPVGNFPIEAGSLRFDRWHDRFLPGRDLAIGTLW